MSGPRLTVVPLENGDVAALLARLPTQAGVAQVLGPDGQPWPVEPAGSGPSLLIPATATWQPAPGDSR